MFSAQERGSHLPNVHVLQMHKQIAQQIDECIQIFKKGNRGLLLSRCFSCMPQQLRNINKPSKYIQHFRNANPTVVNPRVCEKIAGLCWTGEASALKALYRSHSAGRSTAGRKNRNAKYNVAIFMNYISLMAHLSCEQCSVCQVRSIKSNTEGIKESKDLTSRYDLTHLLLPFFQPASVMNTITRLFQSFDHCKTK